MTIFRYRAFISAALILYVQLGAAQLTEPIEFAVAPYKPIRSLLTDFQPLRLFLEKKLGRSVLITTTRTYKQFSEALFNNEYTFALLPTPYAQLAEQNNGYRTLLVVPDPLEFSIVVRKDSPIKGVAELTGKKVLGASIESITTIWLERLLEENKIELKTVRFEWTPGNSLVNGLNMLVNGEADAALASNMSMKIIAPTVRDKLRVLQLTNLGPVNFVVLSGPKASADLAKKMSQALLDYASSAEGKHALSAAMLSPFRTPRTGDFRLPASLLSEFKQRSMKP